MNKSFSWSLLSRYRSVLMGIAIIGVMITHFFDWTATDKVIVYFFKPITGIVFTEGFLLLSGLGLFYSFKNNSNIYSFFKKRVFRLVIPFIIISAPFYLWQCISKELPWWIFVEKVTSLYYWFWGNDGMWYISVSILLYLLFPVLYKFLFQKNRLAKFKGILLLGLFYGLGIFIFILLPDYWKLIKEGLSQMPMFAIGIILGYMSYNSLHFKREQFLFVTLGILAIISNLCGGIVGAFGDGFLRLFCTILLCILLLWLENNHNNDFYDKIKAMLKWFGNYTLELYILHIFIYIYLKSLIDNSFLRSCLAIAIAICVAQPLHNLIKYLLERKKINES